jgi:hypothetical protein
MNYLCSNFQVIQDQSATFLLQIKKLNVNISFINNFLLLKFIDITVFQYKFY